MSRYALLGRISRTLRDVIAGQIPHDLASQVPVMHGPDVVASHDRDVEDRSGDDSDDSQNRTAWGQDVERRVEVAT